MRPFRSYGTLKSSASYMWFDESSILIEWFLPADSDSITFGLTTNVLSMFDISWVPTAVVLAKNDVLILVSAGKVSNLVFRNVFFF